MSTDETEQIDIDQLKQAPSDGRPATEQEVPVEDAELGHQRARATHRPVRPSVVDLLTSIQTDRHASFGLAGLAAIGASSLRSPGTLGQAQALVDLFDPMRVAPSLRTTLGLLEAYAHPALPLGSSLQTLFAFADGIHRTQPAFSLTAAALTGAGVPELQTSFADALLRSSPFPAAASRASDVLDALTPSIAEHSLTTQELFQALADAFLPLSGEIERLSALVDLEEHVVEAPARDVEAEAIAELNAFVANETVNVPGMTPHFDVATMWHDFTMWFESLSSLNRAMLLQFVFWLAKPHVQPVLERAALAVAHALSPNSSTRSHQVPAILPKSARLGRIRKEKTVVVLRPRSRSLRVATLPLDAPVLIMEKRSRWIHVEFITEAGFRDGWVRSKYVHR